GCEAQRWRRGTSGSRQWRAGLRHSDHCVRVWNCGAPHWRRAAPENAGCRAAGGIAKLRSAGGASGGVSQDPARPSRCSDPGLNFDVCSFCILFWLGRGGGRRIAAAQGRSLIAQVADSGALMATYTASFLPAPLSPRMMQRSRSEEHTSELQSRVDLVCRLLLEKKKKYN